MRRLKVPAAIAQFFNHLDKDNTKKLFSYLHSYKPETRAEKKTRLKALSLKEIRQQKRKANKPITLKFGLNHVTYLIEQKKAKLVLIAADVDPIETVVFLPTLCRAMGVPFAIVQNKANLGRLVGKKSATVVALTDFKAYY
jgi:large subunit ribosomal protein L7Ae